MNILFVCSRNQWRSPTGEKLFRSRHGFATRSRGTSAKARRQIALPDIKWADVIFVMESKHKQRLYGTYSDALRFKTVHILGIPDDFQFMDPKLIELLQQKVEPILKEITDTAT